MDIRFVRGCKVGKGIFASFIELEADLLKNALQPMFIPMSNNVICQKRYGAECHMGCKRFIDGIVSGPSISWRMSGKTM